MKGRVGFALLMVLVVLAAGCGGKEGAGIQVESAWMRQSPTVGDSGAAYMVIRNQGESEDTLLAAASSAAAMVELHETMEMEGMMHMAPVAGGVTIPAGGEVELAPGGMHLMFMGLTQELTPGDTVEITLTFAQAGEVVVTADIREE